MSKYPSLPNSELLPSKIAKLQGLDTDIIEALNLEIYNFLKNVHQNTPKLQGLPVSHYDVIMTSYNS